MRIQRQSKRERVCRVYRAVGLLAISSVMIFSVSTAVFGANTWDGGGGSQWWFDPVNWNTNMNVNTALPASDGVSPTPGFTDGQINIGTTALPGGEGVVYDPVNDPFFPAAGSLKYPTGSALLTQSLEIPRDYGPQTLYRFYMSRNTTATNLLTIKSGDLVIESNMQIGRSGSTGTGVGQQNLGEIVQTGGSVRLPLTFLELGQRETSGWGNGTYDYRGGVLEVGKESSGTSIGIKLSNGSANAGFGGGGVGTFISRNPATGGHILTLNYLASTYAGSTDDAAPQLDADGVTTGVGISEFHYQNGGTRPIQVLNNLAINNGVDWDPTAMTGTHGIRSSRLRLVLDSAPTVNGSGVPNNIGLFDVNSDNTGGGAITGTGDLNGDGITNNDRVFSNADAANPLDNSAAYREGGTVSAKFGSTIYNWTISYTGNITWSDQVNSVVSTITGAGTGVDVVLIGLSSVSAGVPGDYNNNGIVDAADYVIWRKNSGQSVTIPNDPTPGTVTQADYDFWKAHFGATSGAGAGLNGGGAVPEPSSLMLALVGMIGFGIVYRRRTA